MDIARMTQARQRVSAQMAAHGSSRLRRWHLAAWLAATVVSGPAAAAIAQWLAP